MALPIHYINLDSRPDRRQLMEQQFLSLGLDAHRLQATSPATLTLRPTGADHPDMRPREPMVLSELACLESHARIWKKVAAGADEIALILEDDIVLSSRCASFLRGLVPSPQWDILRIETNFHSVRLGDKQMPVSDLAARRLMQPQSGAGAYILTREAARTYLASPYFGAVPADTLIYSWPHVFGMKVWHVLPGLAAHLEQIPGRGGEAAAQSEIDKTRQGVFERAQARQSRWSGPLPRVLRIADAARRLLPWFSLTEIFGSRRITIPFDDVPAGYSR